MELTHEGHHYKQIVVTAVELGDLASTEKFSDYNRYIIDCRTIKPGDILSKLTSFCQLIRHSKVSHVWINCRPGKFLEIKERLGKLLTENGESLQRNHAILKLSTQDQSVPVSDALKISTDVLNFGNNLNDIHRLLDVHPGLLNGKVHLNNSLKRKRPVENVSADSAAALPSGPYADKRRPGKKVFKALKRTVAETNDNRSRSKCYMCNYRSCFDQLCEECHSLNGQMKKAPCDLKGRYAIVTGGRIKIGYETALRLLRDECFVIVTTRFPADAVERFSKEEDFSVWKQRLKIARLDLQDMRSIEEFLAYVHQNIPHVDILINNAAQTIFRPFQYYESLISEEVKQLPDLAKDGNNLVVNKNQALEQFHSMISTAGRCQALTWKTNSRDFPEGKKDEHGEQLDTRLRNSWTYSLDEVPLQELLQVLTINAVGPFILTAKLKPLLRKSPFQRKFVVNVSAMEGQFSRINKGHRHPHTNMAKAAMNMMTRTSGLEFQMDAIYMTAVDTGWVTDERPFHQAQHEADVKGFVPPLDCQDGAARVYHPIVHGLNPNNSPYFAVFLKDFKPKNW